MVKHRPLYVKNLMLVLSPRCLILFLICYFLGNSYGFLHQLFHF